MKYLSIAVLLAVTIYVTSALPQKVNLENVNVDQILKNDRIVTNYVKCLLEKGPCTQEGRELRRTLPEAIRTDCKKCTAVQKANTEKVVKHLREKRPKEWRELINKFDPQGKHKSKYM